jgi:hypothetical protein
VDVGEAMTMMTRRPRTLILMLVLIVAASAALTAAACGGSGSPSAPSPAATVTTTDGTQPATKPTTPAGEVWDYALGLRWDDPAIAAYTQGFGRYSGDGDDPTGHVRSQGFMLNLDGAGVVTSVTLVNDEAALGYGTGFQAYRGRLPFGVSWDETADDVHARLGDPLSVTGGAGLDVGWWYRDSDERAVLVSFRAGDQYGTQVSADAPIHMVEVSGP